MLLFRNIEKSVRQKVATLLSSPPAGSGITNPYNAYGEDSFSDPTFKPNYPFVWVLDVRVPPQKTRLPMILIERAVTPNIQFEIGTRSGTFVQMNLHIFGRTRGERQDLAAFLYQQLQTLELYDFTDTPAEFQYAVEVEGMTSTPMTIAPDVGTEGSLANWESLSFACQFKE